MLTKHTITADKDLKVWNMTIKSQVNELTDSIEKCDEIIKALEDLQKNTKKAKDTLEDAIEQLRKALEASNKELQRKLTDLEKKMKSIGCINNGRELLRAIFTLGLSCLFDSNTKREYENVKVDLKEEQTIIQAMSKRMNFFDDLKGAADTLVKESAGVMNTTKAYRQALVTCKSDLERNFTPDDVEENMGDVDFANDFAEALYASLQELKIKSEEVGAECLQRKHRLDNVLTQINKYSDMDETKK
jgi:DNA repair exonuclease SbcCD ATPase subunit